ncbi:MAG: hypothetical protein V4724_18830 [Pseudomonadota bacterium]
MNHQLPSLFEHLTLLNAKRIVALTAAVMLSGCALVSGNHPIPTSANDEKLIDDAFNFPIANVPLITHQFGTHPVRHFTFGFDGTMNDRDRVPPGEQPTITAKITSRLKGRYSPGPGMQSPHYRNLIDGMFGYSSSTIAQKAADELMVKAKELLNAEPQTEIRVFVTGFSRGSAIARHFMNLVDQRAQASETMRNHIYFYAILFDTVPTGQTDTLDLPIAPSLDYLVHFVARDESRVFFKPLVDRAPASAYRFSGEGIFPIPERINEIPLPGAHSDIGGAYEHGIGAMYQQLSEELLFKMGLINQDCWDTPDHVIEDGKHDSRGIFDRLLGALSPHATSVRSREGHSLPYYPLSYERAAENAERLRAMSFANAARSPLTQRSRITAPQPNFTVLRDGEEMSILAFPEYVDASTLAYSKSPRQLTFRYIPLYGAGPYTMRFPNTVWQKIPDKKPATLAHRALIHDGKQEVFTHIDDVPVAITSSGQAPQPQSTRRGGCRIGPDEEPRRTMEFMIISTKPTAD